MMAWLLAAPWILALVVVMLRYAARGPFLRGYAPRPEGPALSVVIPARNEAVNIEACIRAVLATAYRPLEVVVVDDCSTDATPEIVRRLAQDPAVAGRVRLVTGQEVPPGWFGKPWALAQGYRATSGDLLVFTDADTRHGPDLIPRAVTALRVEHVDLVSVIPRQEMGSFWERLVQPHVFFVLHSRVGNLDRVNRTRTPWNAIANGQFILTTRIAYEAVGTHAAVRDAVAEDMWLAQEYVRGGRDIFLVHAIEMMTTRMYRSLREIIEGWSKNLAIGAPLTMPPIAWMRRLLPYVMWLPALLWIGPPLAWLLWHWDFALIASAASLLLWIEVYRREGAPVWYAFLYPVAAGVVAYIMLRSAQRGSRRVEWRGRVYRKSGNWTAWRKDPPASGGTTRSTTG
jgi:chlorobactene glucosyltransferase